MSVAMSESTQPSHILLEGLIKHWDNRKWKLRWTTVSKLSPVADCLYVSLYRSCKDKFRSGDPKKVVSLEEYLGTESGFTHENETNTLAVICKKDVFVFAFDTREILAQWKTRLQSHFCREQHFVVQILKTPNGSKIGAGPARLIVQNLVFCLVASLPPRLLGYWPLDQLRRFGEIEGKLCFEAGSHCKVPGLYILYTSQATEIVKCLELASSGQLLQCITHTGSDCDSIFDDKSLVYGTRGASTLKSGSSDTSSNCESCSNFGSTVNFNHHSPAILHHTSLHNIAQQYHNSAQQSQQQHNCSTLKKPKEICNSNHSQAIQCQNCTRITHHTLNFAQQQQQQYSTLLPHHHHHHLQNHHLSQSQQQQQQQIKLQQNRTVSLFGTIRNHSNTIVPQQNAESNGIDQTLQQHHHSQPNHHVLDNAINSAQHNTTIRSHLCPLPVFTGHQTTIVNGSGNGSGGGVGGNSAGNSSSSPSTTTSSSTDRESIFSHSSSEANDIDHQLHRLEEALLSFETPALNFSHLYSQIDFAARASARASLASTTASALQPSQEQFSAVAASPAPLSTEAAPTTNPPPALGSYGNYDVPKNVCVHSSCLHGDCTTNGQTSDNNVPVGNNSSTINHCQCRQYTAQHVSCSVERIVDNDLGGENQTVSSADQAPTKHPHHRQQHVSISAVGVIPEMSPTTTPLPNECCQQDRHHHQVPKSADYENIQFVPYHNLEFTVGHDPQFPPPPSPSCHRASSTELLEQTSTCTVEHRKLSGETESNWQCRQNDETLCSSAANYESTSITVDCSQSQMTVHGDKQSTTTTAAALQHKCLNANGLNHCDGEQSQAAGNTVANFNAALQSSVALLGASRDSARLCVNSPESTCDRTLSRNGTICEQSSSSSSAATAHLHTSTNINGTRQPSSSPASCNRSRSIGNIHSIVNIDPQNRRQHRRWWRRHKSMETLYNAHHFNDKRQAVCS